MLIVTNTKIGGKKDRKKKIERKRKKERKCVLKYIKILKHEHTQKLKN